ncbi:MAG: sporulation membrane protein YtaF [Dethiobacteria bacterium]|jgi:putative sporulation protein YtaF
MEFFAALLLAVALSVDGFAVGLSYGIGKVKITFFPIVLITLCSALAMTISIFAGQLAGAFFTLQLAGILGGSILILIGLWQLVEGLKKYKNSPILLRINLKMFGLVLQVIREPENADIDRSGDINLREALLLGIALNLDAIGAGFGAGLAGFSLLLIPIVTLALFFALFTGLLIGEKYATGLLGEKGYIIPGFILIAVGLINILC